jgi:hypothetical protein
MPGPIGNKHAVGNKGGRPREYDLEKVASDLTQWANLNSSINLCGFSAEYMIPPSTVIRWASENDVFREAYDLAKCKIAQRRELMLNGGALHVKAFDLNATVYDQYTRDEKRSHAEFESELRQKETEVAHQSLADLAKLPPEQIAQK